MAISMDELMRVFGRPMAPMQNVQDMPIGQPPQTPAQAPAQAPQRPAQAPQAQDAAPAQRRGLLGFLGDPDRRARLAIALEGMTLNPNQALIGQMQRGIETRAEKQQKNATAEWLRSRGRDDLAEAMLQGGLPAAEALQMAMTPGEGPKGVVVDGKIVDPRTGQVIYEGAPGGGDPMSTIGKLAADLSARRITQEQYDLALQNMAPQGMTIESDGAGGFRLVQGAGAGNKPWTEGQSKDNVYATRARGALQVLDPIADELTSLSGRAAGLDPTGIIRSRVQSPNYQVARNAGDEFLQAILRKDTGAAITADEQTLYGGTYLPQPGDGPEVLQAKKAARSRAIDAINSGMSPAQMIAVERALNSGASGQPSDDDLLRMYGGN